MTDKLTIVCWKWKGPIGYRSAFTWKQVNTFYNMVSRHYHKPFEMVCLTDDPKGITSDVRVEMIPEAAQRFAKIPSPHGGLNPTCYRRLWMYSDEAKDLLGERFVSVDLDLVIVDDVTSVWDRTEDFMIWGETLRRTPYNGSMQLMTAGARRQVYYDFDPATSPGIARKAGMDGSDQAWISYKLGPLEKRWTMKDGVFSYRLHVKPHNGAMPEGARIIFFEGQVDPWSPHAHKTCPWLKDHYR